MNAMTTNGVLAITNDERIQEIAKRADLTTRLAGDSIVVQYQCEIIERERKNKTLDLRDDLQSLSKLADLAQYTEDGPYYAKLYLALKQKLLTANELANADKQTQTERYTVTARDL